jgi:uracil phosphoribosyltransferase
MEQPVLVTILRAGVPFYQGFLNMFDKADSGFIGAFRTPFVNEKDFDISMDYLALPDFNNKQLIVIDPMLATGKSVIKALDGLLHFGKPSHIHFASVISASEGIEFLKNNVNMPFTIWTGAIDEKLNSKSYIVPGLGDAGDLAYGEKM